MKHGSFLVYFMQGMKVYVTDDKELIMEPLLKWAGNPNILIAAKAFGLKATVQVLSCMSIDKAEIIVFNLLDVACLFCKHKYPSHTHNVVKEEGKK